MDPNQRRLFQRYSDVIVHDTTFKTNRFGMALHCFVAVDCENKTRLVANALTVGQKESDQAWVLAQLVKSAGQPTTILVDNDHAMDAALANDLETTQVINCIWHINKNLRSKLSSKLGKERWSQFKRRFFQARDSITEEEFQLHWSSLLAEVGGDGVGLDDNNDAQPLKYLQRLYNRKHHWAGPWIYPTFTAGMRSTQRVEKANHLIKVAQNNKKSLKELFDATNSVVSTELFTTTQIKNKWNNVGKKPKKESRAVARVSETSLRSMRSILVSSLKTR